MLMPTSEILASPRKDAEWWRTSVIYQIYPRSFADGNGDGMGDLLGVTERMHVLKDLGVDAIWFSPFFKSPQKDAGYDVSDYKDIDPLFGNLNDFDDLVAKAKSLGLRIIVDLVPNHSSDQHAWFQAALKAAPGSAERNRYIFREGKGENGELPPNNWESVFGGNAWTRITEADGTPGQWYLHIFDSTQPDFNWENQEVKDEFDSVLRFWLDRGASGFRIDVAHGMIKAKGLPDVVHHSSTMSGQDSPDDVKTSETDDELIARLEVENPFWGQPGVHDIIRGWRKILDEYDDRGYVC